MKKAFKYIKRFFLAIFLLLASYFLMAFILSSISTNPKKYECEQKESIYLLSNGIHLDIILKTSSPDQAIITNLNKTALPQYLAFGWGDEDFYLNTPTWNELTLETLIKAMFLKSNSVMHVSKHYRKRSDFVEVKICPIQQQQLIAFILASFEVDNNGNFIEFENAGYSNNDFFYRAKGSYTCFNTCNEWVNRGLKKSGIKTSIWSPFDKGILYHVKKN